MLFETMGEKGLIPLLDSCWGLLLSLLLVVAQYIYIYQSREKMGFCLSPPFRSSSTSQLVTQPCPSMSAVTSLTGCTTPSSVTPSLSSSSSATSTTRPTVASSPGEMRPPPRRARPSRTEPLTDSARPPTEPWGWEAERTNPRRTLAGERGKDGLKEIRGRGARKEVKKGLGLVLA